MSESTGGAVVSHATGDASAGRPQTAGSKPTNRASEVGQSADKPSPGTRAPREQPPQRKPPLSARLIAWSRRSIYVLVALLSVAVVAILLLVVFILPDQLVGYEGEPARPDFSSPQDAAVIKAYTDLAVARNSVRTTLLQGVAGALFLVTAFTAWQQVATARRGQATERFTKSIDQLGSDKTDVRLGGIYALHQMSSSPDFRKPVAEVLGAYLHTRAEAIRQPLTTAVNGPSSTPEAVSTDGALVQEEAQSATAQVRPDVQAVLRILFVEDLWGDAGIKALDLRGVLLAGADIAAADFGHVGLAQADLSRCNVNETVFHKASMQGVRLADATGFNPDFSSAGLEGADFSGAVLPGAVLSDARARGLKGGEVELDGCKLIRADLTGASLIGADLQSADVEQAVLRGADLTGANLSYLEHAETLQVDRSTVLIDVRVKDDITRTKLQDLMASVGGSISFKTEPLGVGASRSK